MPTDVKCIALLLSLSLIVATMINAYENTNMSGLFTESDYVTIVTIVPESHAEMMREVLAKTGAGESDYYSHGSFSVKGMSRFKPKQGSHPFIGQENKIEEVIEERIETICSKKILEQVIVAINRTYAVN